MTAAGHRLPISVVLPTHNRSQMLPRAIRSVLAQTAPPAELIVVDDASTEDIAGLVADMGDDRIRCLRLETRGGPGAARNAGARAAASEWIAFQDSDDEWLIDKLAVQWAAVEQAEAQPVLVCGSYLIVPRGRSPEARRPSPNMRAGQWDAETLAAFPFIAPTWLVQRDAFTEAGGFDAALPNLEDWELAFRLKQQGALIALDDFLVVKHGSADGLNRYRAERLQSMEAILARHGAVFSQAPPVIARMHREIARIRFELGQEAPARSALWQALTIDPGMKNITAYLVGLLGRERFRRALRLYRATRSSQ